MTQNQKAALRQALGTHSLGMVTKSMTPEELQELPEDYQVPTYTANASPLYDNQLFPKIASAEDLINIGYATPDGRSTQSGQMAIALKKAGALNDDYTLNDTGKAMMANPADLLEEENLPLYLKAKELDLDGSGRELSWGETFGRFYKESKDSVKALYNIASGPAPTTKEEKAAFDLEVQAGLGGAVKSGAALAMGLSEIAGSGLIKALSDTEAEEDLALASLNQRFEKLDYEIKNAKAADVIDGLGEMLGAELGVSEAREQNIQTVGEERAKEIEQRGESAGQFAAMFSPYGPAAMTGKVAFGVAGKGLSAAFKPISRSLLQADIKAAQVLDKTKQLAALQRQASGLQVATQAAEKKAVFAESMAQRLSQAGLVDRANNAVRIANQLRTKGQEAATRLGGFTDEIATVSDDLAKATQSANVADKVLQVTQKARQIPYLPITALGKTLEATGRSMIGIDKGLSSLASKIGADKAYNAMNKITSLSGLGGAGAALGLGPAAFIPAAIRATWSTAPFIKATGEYVSLIGKEAAKARGQIGFWKRIYEMPNKGPAHRAISGLMDTATMGGRIPSAVSNVGKGLAASYPVDLAYEWVSEGGDFNPNILKQAAVETLFFGGTGAALGGITMGSANRIKALQNGDALNFYRSISDPSQRVMYNGMPSDMKRVIGTFSASNPGAKIQFVNEGAGAYDPNTKTVMVNPNAANPLKPLLTHEFMHHMLNNGIGDGVVAQLVGDGFQTGGLLRGKDGNYDPQYEAFKNEYVNRLRSQHERNVKMRDAVGDPMTKSEREFQTPDEKYLAEEYFIETNVDDMLGMAESGKLGGIAGRMIINDKVRALGDAILNKSAILRDLHFRIGGVMDNKGKMVTGNGFLSGKLYQSPEIRRMFQKMVNESVGRKGGIDAAKRKARNGIEITIRGKDDPILGEITSPWETDADGNAYLDANGDYIPLKKETEELRSQAGFILADDMKARLARGEVIPEGELSYNPDNNTWSGQYLNDRQIELLNLSGRFNSKQIKQLNLLNAAARDTSNMNADPASRGNRFSVIYQPALKKNRKGQWRYDQIKPQLRDVVPYGVEISKDGNILIRVMSTNQLFANASEKSASKRGRALYDGNMETILRDVNAVIDLHGKNQPTDAYFKDKYGGEWEQHKAFINSVFGNVGAGQKDINPLVASDRVDAVVKSYRLDRMNKATQLVGSTQLPYQNNLVKINYLPEGEPIMDANGEPKDLRYTPKYEPATEQARQMPESLDADYMKAVESGDVDAQQELVDKIATATGHDLSHRESEGGGDFKKRKDVIQFVGWSDKAQPRNIGYGSKNYLMRSSDIPPVPEWAVEWLSKTDDMIYWSEVNDRPAIEGAMEAMNPDDIVNGAGMWDDREAVRSFWQENEDRLSSEGIFAFKTPDGAVIFDPYTAEEKGVIKSADPVVRDDSGNVIPLSQRFDVKSSNISYMPEQARQTPEPEIDKSENPIVTQKVFSKLEELLKQAEEEFPNLYVGVRALTRTEKIKPGESFRESSEWKDGVKTRKKLGGTAVFKAQNLRDALQYNLGSGQRFAIVIGDDLVPHDMPERGSAVFSNARAYAVVDPAQSAVSEKSSSIRYMPEPDNRLQKGYDYGYLDSVARDPQTGAVQLTRSIGPNEALPLISERIKIDQKVDSKSFDFTRPANVKLYTNNGNDVRFRFDPNLLEKPQTKDFAVEHSGKRFQIAMADRHTATGGDMGGVLFPWLKSNQETIIGDDGIEYKIVWANNRWNPVLTMRKKAFQQGIFDLGIYIMGEDAHGSNLRTVRTVSNEINHANISEASKKLLLASAYYGVKSENISHYTGEIKKKLISLDEVKSRISEITKKSDPELMAKLKKEKDNIEALIKVDKRKLSQYAFTASEIKLGALIKNYKSTMTGFRNGTKSQKVVDTRLSEMKSFVETKDFKNIAKGVEGKQMISLGSSFDERKAAVNNTYGIEIDGFNTLNVANELSDFKGATINQIVASVELSKNPELFAMYLGNDPRQAKFMTPQESAAAEKFKSNPNFVPHESYEWVMLGPKNGNNFLNSNPKRLVEYVPDYSRQYYKKTGKLGPGAAETSIMGAARDSQEVILELP